MAGTARKKLLRRKTAAGDPRVQGGSRVGKSASGGPLGPLLLEAERHYRRGRPLEAIRAWKRILRFHPDIRPTVWNRIGDARLGLGDRRGAISAYRRAVSSGRRYPLGWFNLANAYAASGNCRQAVHSYRKALSQEPEMVEVFRKQVGEALYKIWPAKPLEPGEYGVVEYTDGKMNLQIWDFTLR